MNRRKVYAEKYGLSESQIGRIGAKRMRRMTELGRELITIFARIESATKPAPDFTVKRTWIEKKSVAQEKIDRVETMMRLARIA